MATALSADLRITKLTPVLGARVDTIETRQDQSERTRAWGQRRSIATFLLVLFVVALLLYVFR